MTVTSLDPYAMSNTGLGLDMLPESYDTRAATQPAVLMAQSTPVRPSGEEQVLQAWGNGVLYQAFTNQGTFQLRWRANEPAQYRQSDFLLFESPRPISLQRDATGNGPLANWPMGGDNRSPVRRAMDDVLDRAEAKSNRIEVPEPPGTPMSDNPLVRFYRGVGGAIRGLTGDAVEALARIAPYIPEGNGMVVPMALTPEQQRGLDQTRQLQQQTSNQAGNAVAGFNDTLGFAMGLPPDSPEVTFGRIAIGVAEGVEGLVGMGRGALSLVREGGAMRLAVRNTEILAKLARPNAQQLGRIAEYVDHLTPTEYGAMPTQLKTALRDGLQANAADTRAAQALRRLDELDGGMPSSASSSATTPRQLPGRTSATGGALTVNNANVEVVANYVQGIRNPIARQWVAYEANQRLAAGETLDLNSLARIQADVEKRLVLNTRQQIAQSTFTDPQLQAALRQRLADRAGTDVSQNAALANSPQLVQAEAQAVALARIDVGLFNGSGVPKAARERFRALSLDWAQQANPQNPALALEQLNARPEWQGTLLREVAIDQISGFRQSDVASLASTAPDKAHTLAELRLRIASQLDQNHSSAQSLKNLLATPGGSTRSAIVRDAVVDQIGGASPLRNALTNYTIEQGLGERELVELLGSPQVRLHAMRESLIRESTLEGGAALTPQQQGRLRQAIDAKTGTLRSQAEKEQFLKDLSNSPSLMGQMLAEPPPVVTSSSPSGIQSRRDHGITSQAGEPITSRRDPPNIVNSAAGTTGSPFEQWQAFKERYPSDAAQIEHFAGIAGFNPVQTMGLAADLGVDPLSAATLLADRAYPPPAWAGADSLAAQAVHDRIYGQGVRTEPQQMPAATSGNGPNVGRFNSEEEAAMAASAHARQLTASDPSSSEYHTWIYTRGDGSHGYTVFRRGSAEGGLPQAQSRVPEGARIVAELHSHPPRIPQGLSGVDINSASEPSGVIGSGARTIYITNVEGNVDRFRPGEGVVRFVNNDGTQPTTGTPQSTLTPTGSPATNPTARGPITFTQPDVSFELRPQSTDGRTLIVLPDTHGRDDLQQRAFDYLRSQQDWVFGDNTTVVSLGDTIDKGPNSAQNVEALINRDQEPGVSQVITHIGNHELWLTEWLKNPDKLKYAHDWIANRGGRIALESYDRFAKEHPELSSFSLDGIDLKNMPLREVTDANGRTTSLPDNSDGFYTRLYDRIIEGLPQRHLDFFANLQPSTRIGDYFFSHAGADPSRTLDNQGLGALTWIRDPYLRFDGQWIGDPNTIAVSGHTVLRQPLIQENKFALDLGTFMTGDFMAAILQNDLVRFAIFRKDAEPVWTDIRGGFDQNLFAPQFDPSQVIANPKKR
jgi:serine/threonine protein phosphatase 1